MDNIASLDNRRIYILPLVSNGLELQAQISRKSFCLNSWNLVHSDILKLSERIWPEKRVLWSSCLWESGAGDSDGSLMTECDDIFKTMINICVSLCSIAKFSLSKYSSISLITVLGLSDFEMQDCIFLKLPRSQPLNCIIILLVANPMSRNIQTHWCVQQNTCCQNMGLISPKAFELIFRFEARLSDSRAFRRLFRGCHSA